MSQFVKIDKIFDPEKNCWKANPHLPLIPPFKQLHDTDDGGTNSSNHMWAVIFFSDPDEKENRFYRYDEEKLTELLTEYWPDLDLSTDLFKECVEAYPFECLNAIERSLKSELDSMKARARTIKNTPYNFDHYMIDETTGEQALDRSGKPILVKGTAEQLDRARSKTPKLFQDLDDTLQKFMKTKQEEARIFGGRKQTASEKGLV